MNPAPIDHWIVRDATPDDATGVAAIYNHYVDVGGCTFDTEPWTVARAAAYLQVELPDVWLVAESHHQIAGWASARRYSLRHGYRLTCETTIYLAAAYQGSGVADALQQRIDQHCDHHQLHHAVAKVIADNRRSIAFHERHGYELVGIQNEVGRMRDRWVDVAIMQKIYR